MNSNNKQIALIAFLAILVILSVGGILWATKIIPWWQPKTPSSSIPSSGSGPSAPPPLVSIQLSSLGGFCEPPNPASCQVGNNGASNGKCGSSPITVSSSNTTVVVNGQTVMSIADGGTAISTLQGGVMTAPFKWNAQAYATDCNSWQMGSWIGSVLVNSDDSGNITCEYAVFNAANPQGAYNVVPPGFYGANVFKSWSTSNTSAGDGANLQSWVTYALTSPPPAPATHRVALAFVLSGTAAELATNSTSAPSQSAIVTQTLQTLATMSCLDMPAGTCKNLGKFTLWPSVTENVGYCGLFDFASLSLVEAVTPQSPNTVVGLSLQVPN